MAPQRRRPHVRPRPSGPWKHGPIPVIGLVGGIGSGKSAVAARLEALGAFVIDADKVGHALLNQSPVRERVLERFGPTILKVNESDDEPEIDRAALGAIVFADPAARKALESIVHPRMKHTFEKAVSRVVRRGESRAVVLDAAILFEAGWNSLCDLVFFVDSPREARLARLAASRNWDDATLTAREKAQWALIEKRGRADREVANTGDLERLQNEVERAWKSVRPPVPTKGRAAATAAPAVETREPGPSSEKASHVAPGSSPERPRGRR